MKIENKMTYLEMLELLFSINPELDDPKSLPEYFCLIEALKKAQSLEEIMEKKEIPTIEELNMILEDYHNMCLFNMFCGAFIESKGLAEEFEKFVNKTKIEENTDGNA